MKCVKLVDSKKLELSEMEIPNNEEKVVFKVNASGICGSDLHYFEVGNPKGLVMGHEFSGVVVNPGKSDFKVGDRITALPISPCGKCDACKSGNVQYCKETWSHATGLSLEDNGAYAEYSSCFPNMARLLPEEVTDEEAAMAEPTAVSLHAVKLADIKVGDKVCIIGAGIIGLMAAEFAKMEGATYVALLETNPLRGEKALSYGFTDEYYNALDENNINLLREKTGGFDKVIECCGNSQAVSEAISITKNGGEIILVGVSLLPITIPSVIAVMGEITLKGSIAYSEFDFDRVIELIKNKSINVEKYIDKVVSLEEVQNSFLDLSSGKTDKVKIIVKPNK